MMKNPSRQYWNDQGATSESHYLNRRHFISQLAVNTGALIASATGVGQSSAALSDRDKMYHIPEHALSEKLYPAKQNADYKVSRELTSKDEVFTYNNFYEFSLDKKAYRYVEPHWFLPWERWKYCSPPPSTGSEHDHPLSGGRI